MRGRLRVYLGAAPGVGKTHAMLDEGLRRANRGARVVVGAIDTAGRPLLGEMLRSLEGSPSPDGSTAGDDFDVAGVLLSQPDVVLVDDMAKREPHSGVARYELIDKVLEAGVDVITTVNVCEIESLRDLVVAVVGSGPDHRVPDAVLRAADQVELVDMSPEALRRRLAHGNVFPPERVDAALAQMFRLEKLGALRQIALLWMADRVEDQLHGSAPVEARERVVVALSGRGGSALVRRAARLVGRVGGQFVGLHVVTPSATAGPDLEAQRQLVVELGGTYREVVAEDVAAALARFAGTEHATQIGIGSPVRRRRGGDVVDAVIAAADGIDVHVVRTETASLPRRTTLSRLEPRRSVSRRAYAAAWILCLVGLPLLTLVFGSFRNHVSIATVLLLDLCVVLATATMGGRRPGLVASVAAFALTNWFLTPPLHTLAIRDVDNVVALTVFVVVTVVVSVLVDRAARRSREATRARAEAGALARSSATLVGAHDPLPELLEQVRVTFEVPSASILERSELGWWPTATTGQPPLLHPDAGTSIDLAADGSLQLVLATQAVGHDQLDVLRAFADQLSVAVQGRRLRADAAQAELLAEANALREALLQAVSHDFRTPLATIKASATGLLQTDIAFNEEDRRLLLTDIDGAADQLERMVRDLLDMSRLRAGALELTLGPVALEEVVGAALGAVGPAAATVEVDVSDALPLVLADAVLLERVVANLVSNALGWSPPPLSVRVEAGCIGDRVDLRIVDRGPGIPASARNRMFEPFQRFGDRSADAGVGLGLAIALGFVEAIGGSIEAEDTPGGGLTMTVRLRLVPEAARVRDLA